MASVDTILLTTYQIFFYISAFVIAIAYKDVVNRLRILIFRSRSAILQFINFNNNAIDVVVKVDGSSLIYKDKRFFVNPKKAINKNGVKMFTFVYDNTFAHDYKNRPEDILEKMMELSKEIELTNKKWEKIKIKDITEYAHDVTSEPFMIDAKIVQTTLTNAYLSNASAFDKILKLFSNKNLMTYSLMIAIAAAVAAGLSWLTYNAVSQAPLCKMTAEAVQTAATITV